MGMVFPASREEKCPRHDCASRQVEPLDDAEFACPGREPATAVWLCMMCQRPFKVVRERDAAGTSAATPDRPRRTPHAAHTTERRSS